MNFRRKMRRRTQRVIPTGKQTRRAMMYRCRDCDNSWRMWLELGLEENNENHKPVPFAIPCKYCDGIAYHVDWDLDISIENPVPIFEGVDYFANIEGSECGVPRYANGKVIGGSNVNK